MPQKRPSREEGDAKAAKKASHLADAPLSNNATTTKKTERSHEENQERAYIAASRRSDRSIEARLQSARMASEIHKRRTGKSFRITEEIVRKEEMYEEEEDDLPRSYRILNPNMQTDSPEFNARIEAWMHNKLLMADYMRRANDEWNGNTINRLFAQSFPQANQQAQEMARQMNIPPTTPYPQQSSFQQPASPYQQPQSPSGYPQQQSPFHQSSTPQSPMSPSFNPNANSRMMAMGPSPMTAVSPAPQSPAGTMSMPSQQLEQSAFTSELPPEMLMMPMDLPGNMADFSFMGNMGQSGFTGNAATFQDNSGGDKLAELDQQGPIVGDTWSTSHNTVDAEAWDTYLDASAFEDENE